VISTKSEGLGRDSLSFSIEGAMGERGFSGVISTTLDGFGRFSLSFSVGGAIVSSFVVRGVIYSGTRAGLGS